MNSWRVVVKNVFGLLGVVRMLLFVSYPHDLGKTLGVNGCYENISNWLAKHSWDMTIMEFRVIIMLRDVQCYLTEFKERVGKNLI